MKKLLVTLMIVIFIVATAAPVFAQDITWSTTYDMDGSITFQKQLGHFCNTGAEMKQTINGEGKITKIMESNQVAGKITVSDQNDWVTAEDAVRNLTVTSTIHLCAPAKHVLGEVNVASIAATIDEEFDTNLSSEVEIIETLQAVLDKHEGATIPVPVLYELLQGYGGAVAGAFLAYLGLDMDNYIEPLTKQIWAVQVEAQPGWSGNLHQDFEAANGPWAYAHNNILGDRDDAWWFVDGEGEDMWGNLIEGIFTEGPGVVGDIINGIPGVFTDGMVFDVKSGKDYVGNYFNIEQMARTSQGTVKRFIDISSPWSHGYIFEDMTATGYAEISDAFSMSNLAPGSEAIPEWWELF
ncbi:MAG: hypothetical protein SVV67_08015 [Bacillota bacterium]|nr:hypothetical protein [Bacillota bacterium]